MSIYKVTLGGGFAHIEIWLNAKNHQDAIEKIHGHIMGEYAENFRILEVRKINFDQMEDGVSQPKYTENGQSEH